MRFVIGAVLALSVGIGAYLGSAQVADSAKTPHRRVTLRIGDIALVGGMPCRVSSGSVRRPAPSIISCSIRNGRVGTDGGGVDFEKKLEQVRCGFEEPLAQRHHSMLNTGVFCSGPHGVSSVSVLVLPGGIIAVSKKAKIVYRDTVKKR